MFYFVSLFLKINTNYAEYSLDPNIQEPARQNNGTGSDMTNDDAINIRNVKYKYITNPESGRKVLLHGRIGRNILKKYINRL